MGEDGHLSSKAKSDTKKLETEGSLDESSQRRKSKLEVRAPKVPCVAKEREEIPSTSKGSSNFGEDLEENGIQTRSKTLPHKK